MMSQHKKALMLKFFTIVFGCVGGFVLLLCATLVLLLPPNFQEAYRVIDMSFSQNVDQTGGGVMTNLFTRPTAPPSITFLLAGEDDEHAGADVVILGHFNTETKNIDLISVPRDFLVTLSTTTMTYMTENGRSVREQDKLVDLYSRGGLIHGPSVVRKHFEEWFDITIDHEIIIDLDAFRIIVDALGPIYFDVPQRMFYNDFHGFVIDIQPGLQAIDGAMAEGLVRFRGYRSADLGRIAMQQAFMQEVFAQTLQSENVLRNIPTLLTVFFNYVRTDVSLSEALTYVPFVFDLSAENLRTHTLEGYPVRLDLTGRGEHGLLYLIPDEEQIRVVIDQVFHGIYPEKELEEPLEDMHQAMQTESNV